jgi:Flp pilus assembly protein TadD
MRSAEFRPSSFGVMLSTAALCIAITGCASVTDPIKSAAASVTNAVKDAVTPSSSAASAPASAKAASAPATTAAAKPLEPEQPVAPNVQRAYDDARRALRSGRNDDAERAMRALAQSNPDLGGPHANLGVIHRQAGKLPEAVADFEKATALNPRQPVYFNQLGLTYRMNGQFAKAREAYEKAIELDPNYAQAVLNLGILNDMYLWDSKRALELYDRYLALTPGGDPVVTKWIADLKNRKQAPITAGKKEKA